MKKKPLKVYWWRGAANSVNIGDEINGKIVEYTSARKVERTTIEHAEVLAIGSVIDFPQRNGCLRNRLSPYFVWGSGSMASAEIEHQEKYHLAALRGPLTSSLFHQYGQIPYGDPGLLISRIWEADNHKKYSWGIVPHHSQKDRPWVKKIIENTPNSVFIDVQNPDIDSTLKTVSQCDAIASSSLHGLIFADSYNIPSLWLWDGGLHSGGQWKFLDYFSGIRRNIKDPTGVRTLDDMRNIDISQIRTRHFREIESISKRLIQAFPI